MKKNNNQQLLTSILKSAQMGQIGIRSVAKRANACDFKQDLLSQGKEYDALERKAYALASQRGLELNELNPGIKAMTDMMAKSKLMHNRTDAKIAAMMVQGNTMGMIKSIQNAHRYHGSDQEISALSKELLDCENSNIRQMENYL